MTDIAWHFTGTKLRDGSPIPAIGHTLVYPGQIELCYSGYHWSRTPWQALQYAPGNILHKVRVGGKIIENPHDKGVSSERTIIASIDATHLLRRFAADQALSVAHLWPMPDIVREYLTNLDKSKRPAALNAAQDAVWVATLDAERAAARTSVTAAEGVGTRYYAFYAAWNAVSAAPRYGAWADVQDTFNAFVYKAFE